MTREELFNVILEFERVEKCNRTRKSKCEQPKLSPHGIGQVLRLLQVAFLEDMTHETAVDPERRARWENFSLYPEVIKWRKAVNRRSR
jgi:hypothetical protein